MKKIIMIACVAFGLFSVQSNAQEAPNSTESKKEAIKPVELGTNEMESSVEPKLTMEVKSGKEMKRPNLYRIKVKDIDGKEFSFESLRGKKILIVNTASKCGYTPQYKELETLYQKMKGNNLVIIGFPSNDFGSQEPGTNVEIKEFCTKNYGVSFPMMSKVAVKGKEICELYQFLTKKELNGFEDSKVEWNFQKYLINENGQLEKVFLSKITPMSDEIVNSLSK